MKKYIVAMILIIVAFTFCYFKQSDKPFKKYEHELALCAMFKDEAPYLKEWIDYHHNVLGATYFYLYNNDSSDDFQEVLQPYIEKGLVELIGWNSTDAHAIDVLEICKCPWDRYQIGAYTNCMKQRALGKVRWVAALDIDEFIVPPKGASSFYQMLQEMSHPPLKKILKNPFRFFRRVGCLKIHWMIFGTSHIWDIEKGQRLTHHLTFRAPEDFWWHINTKCIYRPEAVDICNLHNAYLKRALYRSKDIPFSKCRIHHYYTGTEKRFLEKRKPSPERYGDLKNSLNVVEDRTLLEICKEKAF